MFFRPLVSALLVLFSVATVARSRAAAPATPPFRIGLNGVFIGNNTLSTAEQFAQFRELGVAGLRHVEPGDVGWSSVQAANGLFNFTSADSIISASTGFGYVPTFYGAGNLNYYVPPSAPTTATWSAATYGAQATTYLQTVVNRYKSVVKYWEIANEMNTKTTPPAGLSAADYAGFLVFSRNAIRAADANAQVVIGGELGNYGYPFENAYQWLRDVLAAGGGNGFDVFNYHDYKSWWTLPAHYDQFRAILDANGLQAVPIWVTETAQASAIINANINPAYASVDGQAADTWRRLCLLFGKGAQTVFWHSYWDNAGDTSGFRNMGFANSATNVKKKAWHSFKLLTQKVEGFTSATLVSTGTVTDDNVTGGNGAWVVKFTFADGTQRWAAWSPNNQGTTLTGLTNVASVNVTTVVPATLSADGNTPTWTTSTRTVSNGSVALTLADAPVLIEIASTVVVPPPSVAPTISSAPAAQTITAGATATFSVTAAGTAPLSYQWKKDGVVLAGATNATYSVSTATSASAGSYAVTVTNSAGAVTSAAAVLTINPASYLSNLSVRTTLQSAQIVTVGLVVSGGAKPILLRAAGPTLSAFGLTSAMADPRLELYQGMTKIAENNDWTASLASTFTAVGAFAFNTASKDAALLQTLNGAYTVQTTGTGAGTVLVEGYDAGTGSGTRLINLSARNRVGTGADLLIVGFSASGTVPLRLLIRAVGPTLSGFGVTTVLANPKLEVYDVAGIKIAENDDWEASLAATFPAVGAFALPAGSKDSGLLLTINPGRTYTAQVSGVGATTGEALVEIYEVP